MKTFLILVVGFGIGAAAVWCYNNYHNHPGVESAGQKVEDAAKSARDAAQGELRVLHLRPDDIKDELARTGQVVRRAANEAGHAIADATADARITAAIKTKLLTSRDLSALEYLGQHDCRGGHLVRRRRVVRAHQQGDCAGDGDRWRARGSVHAPGAAEGQVEVLRPVGRMKVRWERRGS